MLQGEDADSIYLPRFHFLFRSGRPSLARDGWTLHLEPRTQQQFPRRQGKEKYEAGFMRGPTPRILDNYYHSNQGAAHGSHALEQTHFHVHVHTWRYRLGTKLKWYCAVNNEAIMPCERGWDTLGHEVIRQSCALQDEGRMTALQDDGRGCIWLVFGKRTRIRVCFEALEALHHLTSRALAPVLYRIATWKPQIRGPRIATLPCLLSSLA
ncbi:hypothetical protein E2P81_ATG06435 [Venturia nashicola]|nr:hypothetical protein E2P81_ATG06435 [Venturia nashicola]